MSRLSQSYVVYIVIEISYYCHKGWPLHTICQNMNDIDIVKSIQSWKRDNFVLLYDKYIKKIYDFVFFKVWNKSEAEDLTSEIFLKAYEWVDRFDLTRESTFSSWIYKIANNLVIDYYRMKKDVVSDELVWEMPQFNDILWDIQNRDKIKEVLDYLDTLDPLQKEIFIMRIWNDMSYIEIAQVVGKSVDNCKQIFSRTMKKVLANVSVNSLLIFIILSK